MSLSLILNTANSGLNTAQQQLRVVSDNVANVNTPGYVRKIADQASLSTQGVGSGVEVARVRLATDRFLQAASLNAGAEAARQGVRYELFDRIQSLFGDPGGSTGFFSQVDSVFSVFAAASEDPASSPRRQDALFKAQSLLDESGRIAAQIQAVRQDADGRIKSAVDQVNSLVSQIDNLNVEIARATVISGDASGAESLQAGLIDQLSSLLDVQVSPRPAGGVSIRTGAGLALVGDGHATLQYARAGAVNAESAFGEVWITEPRGTRRSLADGLNSGEIKGLLELRDVEAPATAERLAELTSHVVDELNRAHNANSAAPAPARLTGRNVGQTLPTALAAFTGTTTIAVVNASGVVQSRADIIFSPLLTVNGVDASADFLGVLNGQLAGAVATFANGALSITASGVNGVAIADGVPASNKVGRGFSHYFGLNDLISTDRTAIYDIGLNNASLHGFPPGQTTTFRFTGDTGSRLRDVEVTIPAGGDVGSLVDALNSTSTGLGRFGKFVLDQQTGVLSFNGYGDPAPVLSVVEDKTSQVPSSVSLTELFGIGSGVRASRADGFSVRTDIRQNPARLALAELNLAAPAGTSALAVGDGRGAARLAAAGQNPAPFQSAGGATGGAISVTRYAAELSGDIGGKAAASLNRQRAAEALDTEATARQTAYEGVNLDEELVLLTTYQQAFNASARMIQAVRELYDTLLGIV